MIRSNRARLGWSLGLGTLVLSIPFQARAQDAGEVFGHALERYEERAAAISGYSVVQESMGYQTMLEFSKEIVEGRSAFVSTTAEGREIASWGNFYSAYPTLGERAWLDGIATVDGHDAYVLRVDDFSGLDLSAEVGAGENEDFEPETGAFYIDSDSYLLRKVEMDGMLAANDATSPFTFEIAFRDWREIEGWLHPFEMQMTATGMPPGMTDADLQETLARLRQMQEEIASTPEPERDALEQMIGPRIQELEQMIESGTFEVLVQTRELTVF
ncbi:MAG: hypothetical protein P8Y07_01160 [Gemmatimonadales bacterium]|jgi:hypothetical protein